MIVMVSGVLILGVYVIFGLIPNEWYPSFPSVIAATFAVILPRVTSVGSGISGATMQKITGYVIAVAGLWDFVSTLRFGWAALSTSSAGPSSQSPQFWRSSAPAPLTSDLASGGCTKP